MEDIVDFLHKVGKLKENKRRGWKLRGVPEPESVADHSFRAAIMALILSKRSGLDSSKCVKLALIHDLPEAITGDMIPEIGEDIPASKKVRAEEKRKRERKAMQELATGIDNEILELWSELEERKTPEAKLVLEIDKLEMLLQVYEYQEQYKDKINIEEFWTYAPVPEDPELKKIFDLLFEKHGSE